jgi:hypothetical protein
MLQVIPLVSSRPLDQAKSHRFQVFQRWVLTQSDLARSEAITKACSAYSSVLDHSQRITYRSLVERKSEVHLKVEREKEHEPCVSSETQHLPKGIDRVVRELAIRRYDHNSKFHVERHCSSKGLTATRNKSETLPLSKANTPSGTNGLIVMLSRLSINHCQIANRPSMTNPRMNRTTMSAVKVIHLISLFLTRRTRSRGDLAAMLDSQGVSQPFFAPGATANT